MQPGTVFFQILTRPKIINPMAPNSLQCVAMTETFREAFGAAQQLQTWAIVSCVVLDGNIPVDPPAPSSIIVNGQ